MIIDSEIECTPTGSTCTYVAKEARPLAGTGGWTMVFDLNNNRTYWTISIEFGEVYSLE